MTIGKQTYKATIGFWLVQDNDNRAVCPSIISNKRINTMEHLPITSVWNGRIITSQNFSEDTIITLIPVVLTVSMLDKDIYEYKNIAEIEVIKNKIDELTSKYIKTKPSIIRIN